MNKEKILNDLLDALVQKSLIRDQLIEKKCKEYLETCGYRVIELIVPSYKKIKNINDLIEFFYALANYYYPSPIGHYRNLGKDRKIAKRFVQSRMEASNLTEKAAIRECALMVELLFKYREEFNFTHPPTQFSVFGQESMGWVTDKLIRIVLEEERKQKERRREELEKEIIDKVLEEKGEEYLRLEGI